MSIEDVLDESKPKSGTALRAALCNIDAIEPFRQSGQMLWCNTGAIILHRDSRFALSTRRFEPRKLDLDPFAGCGIFQGILHQIFEHANQLVAFAEHDQRARRRSNFDLDGAVVGKRLQTIGHLSEDCYQIHILVRPQMRI